MLENFKSSVLAANPHYYDYFHILKFENDMVEFTDGAGQAINTVASGKFQVSQSESLFLEFEFYDIVEINPYRKNEKVRDIKPFKVKCRKEEGTFALWQEVMWRDPSEEDSPWLVSKELYVFDFDPLSFGVENQRRNLYYQTEKKDFGESLRFYYERNKVQQLKLKKLGSFPSDASNGKRCGLT